MLKGSVLLIVYFSLSVSSFAQKQIGYFRGGVSLNFPWNSRSNAVIFPAFTIAPGLRLVQAKDFILSLSFPISFGATFKTDDWAGIDLPVMLDFNLGAAAANDEKAENGIILGAGVGYISAANHYDNEESKIIFSEFWGWRFEFGIDLGKDGDGKDRDILLLNYGRSIVKGRAWVVGISFQIMLSKF